MKLSNVAKICLSGLLIALVIIATRFTPLQNLPILPFVRVSIGPALIIYASILLGPIYGGIVGGASDILGIVLFPSALGIGINPLFTLVYTLLGIIPWLIYKLFKKCSLFKVSALITVSLSLLICVFVTIFLFINDPIFVGSSIVNLELYQKILFSVGTFLLTGVMLLTLFLINKKKPNINVPVFTIASTSVLAEFFILLLLNSLVKAITFDINYLVIVLFQGIVYFINIIIDTFVVSLLCRITNKYFITNNN